MAGKKPVKSFKHGRVSCAVWKNQGGEKGVFYTATFNRSYKANGSDWKQTQSFGLFDLVELILCASEAHLYIAKTVREQSSARDEGEHAGEEAHPE